MCDPSHECVMGADQGHDYTIGFSVSAEIISWITGGFDVSESESTGSHQDCYAEDGDTVCEWYNMARKSSLNMSEHRVALSLYRILTDHAVLRHGLYCR